MAPKINLICLSLKSPPTPTSTPTPTPPHEISKVERIRLNLNANSGLLSERNREVLQYFQHSADHGDINAQTTGAGVGDGVGVRGWGNQRCDESVS